MIVPIADRVHNFGSGSAYKKLMAPQQKLLGAWQDGLRIPTTITHGVAFVVINNRKHFSVLKHFQSRSFARR